MSGGTRKRGTAEVKTRKGTKSNSTKAIAKEQKKTWILAELAH